MNLVRNGTHSAETTARTRALLTTPLVLMLFLSGCQEAESGTNFEAIPRNENISYQSVAPGDVPLDPSNEEYFVRSFGSADPTHSTCVRDVIRLTGAKGAETNYYATIRGFWWEPREAKKWSGGVEEAGMELTVLFAPHDRDDVPKTVYMQFEHGSATVLYEPDAQLNFDSWWINPSGERVFNGVSASDSIRGPGAVVNNTALEQLGGLLSVQVALGENILATCYTADPVES